MYCMTSVLYQVWIQGSSNQKTSNALDHASSHQHVATMNWFKKDQAKASGSSALATYSASPILNVDEKTKESVKKKIDLCYVMAKECLSFTKYPSLHQLEVSHGVDPGPAYKTDVAAQSFTHYIAESQRQTYLSFLSNEVQIFSFILDGSTDAGNVEDELVIIQICE